MNVINDLIRELMYQQDKSISDICAVTGLSYFVVKNIIDYDVSPTLEQASLIMKSFGESLTEVLRLY